VHSSVIRIIAITVNTFKTSKNPQENPYQTKDFKNLKKKISESKDQKTRDFCQMFVISKKETIP
jgi:hypothetical protein